jgi:photosystem II stability/assembly factor-like uncharacterized protein
MPILRRLLTLTLLVIVLSLGRSAQTNQAAEQDLDSSYLPVSWRAEEGLVPIGPEGGSIVVMEMDPNDTNVLYAGSWGSGMYKSRDGGLSWFLINQGLDYLYINSLAMDPTNSAILYAGTYEGGVYKTTNGGETWAPTGPGLSPLPIVYALAIDPVYPNIVYAGTRNQQDGPPWGGGLYKSTDGGASWNKSSHGLVEDWVYDIKIHPNTHNVVYVATHSKGVYKSLDGGEEWVSANKGITDLSTRSIVIDPATPSIVYVGTWHYGGVFKSVDSGHTWKAASSGLYSKVYSLNMDPHNTSILYAATYRKGLMVSTTAGDSWHNTGLYPDLVYNVMIDPSNTQIVYAGTMGDGFYKSFDRGITWNHSNSGLIVTSITGLVTQWTAPITGSVALSDAQLNAVYASINGSGIVKTTDLGKSWQNISNGLGEPWVYALAMSFTDPQTLYAGMDTTGFYITTDGGASWSASNNGLPVLTAVASADAWLYPSLRPDLFDRAFFEGDPDLTSPQAPASKLPSIISIGVDRFNSQNLFLGTQGNGIFRSQNGGGNWKTTNLKKQTVYTILSDPFTASVLYAGCDVSFPALYRSLDNGVSWAPSNIGLETVSVFALAADPVTPGVIYAGTSGGVYRTTDGTASWVLIGLPGQGVTAIGQYASEPSTIFAGTSKNGLFVSKDGGVVWTPMSAGLVNNEITFLALDPGNAPYLNLIGTKGGGVYRLGNLSPASK